MNTSLSYRTAALLRRRYRAIVSWTGAILCFIGLWMLMPLVALLSWPEEAVQAPGFLWPGLILMAAGGLTWRLLRPSEQEVLTAAEGGIIVLLSWLLGCVVCALPLMLNLGLSFSQAVFESVSGWTTTGLSVVDVAHASHVILLYRSLLQLAGGAGLAIIMLAAITGPLGPGLGVAEGRTDQLAPHVRRSAKLVLSIYLGHSILGITLYIVGGMSPFDAVNHSFAAVSTGGFSTRVESIAYWDSAWIEAVSILLMILGNMNFATAYLLLRGKAKAFFANGEIKVLGVGILAGAALLLIFTCLDLYARVSESVRVALFQVVSAITTTGFSTVGYTDWNAFGIAVMVVLMLIGGGTGSTAGGIKQQRVYLMWKAIIEELRRPFLPAGAVVERWMWEGEKRVVVSPDRVRRAGIFVFLYISILAAGTMVLTAYGLPLSDALFEFASALGTVGLSVGAVNAGSPAGVLWTESAAMFLGRLEFLVVFVGMIRLVRDVPRMLSER